MARTPTDVPTLHGPAGATSRARVVIQRQAAAYHALRRGSRDDIRAHARALAASDFLHQEQAAQLLAILLDDGSSDEELERAVRQLIALPPAGSL